MGLFKKRKKEGKLPRWQRRLQKKRAKWELNKEKKEWKRQFKNKEIEDAYEQNRSDETRDFERRENENLYSQDNTARDLDIDNSSISYNTGYEYPEQEYDT